MQNLNPNLNPNPNPETQNKVQMDDLIQEVARDVLSSLKYITGCSADPKFNDFKTIGDVIAVLTDPDAWNEYRNTCAPSAVEFLRAIALMASLCHYSVVTDEVDEAVCSKFYQALGEFIISRDARAFLILDPDYSDP
jgi:hypothetical protein